MNIRIYVEKKDGFNAEAKSLNHDISATLQIESVQSVRIINIYDIFNIDEKTLETAKYIILSEKVCDNLYDDFSDLKIENTKHFALEYLPGQFDQRACSALECINLIACADGTEVATGKIIALYGKIDDEDFKKIKNYYINPVEMREKNLSKMELEKHKKPNDVKIVEGFADFSDEEAISFKDKEGLSIGSKDIIFIRDYFKKEKRNPSETEIKIIDTYWSDHCRHTTFETSLVNIEIKDSVIEDVYKKYLDMREKTHKEKADSKPITLMDLATIYPKYMKKQGLLQGVEISDEVNACSVYMDVDVDGKTEKWLLLFKNETHNHPTEIEPYGGASTCLGGAIRDPLSSRVYVYQALRVSGSGNPLEKVKDTIKGKLPQKKITKTAAAGYSGYGNQIGIATSLVSEIYHDGYKAKRMELGAVLGAAPLENIKREKPLKGDRIILLGGKTGRDGIGGATGSSKAHTDTSIEECGAEVQKGNATEERKIQRLFRNKDFTLLVKKCNDFGAGGVTVAIGELAPGLEIDLSKVPLKYEGLSGTEIAISESQERMAVVVEEKDVLKAVKFANEENIEATVVAVVTEDERLKMKYDEKIVADISRNFLDTNGVRADMNVEVPKLNLDKLRIMKRIYKSFDEVMTSLSVCSQKGLTEMFDSTIGAQNVLMPFGGKYQMTPIDASIHKVPVLNGKTDTCSAAAYGFEPSLSSESPFHGAAYAVVDSIAKIVISGIDYKNIYLSFQEYFQRLENDPKKWSLPFSALLGALYAQEAFGISAIGGKDSMSGSFNDINVPPTFVSFAFTHGNSKDVISPEFKHAANYVYIIKHTPKENLMPDIETLKQNYDYIIENIRKKIIISGCIVKTGGIAEAVLKMSFGNRIGVRLESDIDVFSYLAGSIVVESKEKLSNKNAFLIGRTTDAYILETKSEKIDILDIQKKWLQKLHEVFAYECEGSGKIFNVAVYKNKNITFAKNKTAKPKVFIPVFPGTNCEYDSMRVFRDRGAEVSMLVFRNHSPSDIKETIEKMREEIEKTNILMFSGGFSAADEPDGSGKFIASVITSPRIKEAIEKMLSKDGLILGICNGFQALVKSGLLPNGEIGNLTDKSPTLTFNKIGRHISQMVRTKIISNMSPWLQTMEAGKVFTIPVSHGEGRFMANETVIKTLADNGQIATQYVDFDGNATDEYFFNPNGSNFCIEGITSKDGRIFGKMGHCERLGENLYKNIEGDKVMDIFSNGVRYFS